MLTAQDVREKGFETSKFGGYSMDAVDDFLEEVADTIGVLQKEKADMQKEKADMMKKMKILADKISDYRANEEALNLAVLSAQKLAVQIEADARTRAAGMIADAEKQVKDKLGSIEDQTAAQEKRLADAKAATAKFMDGVRAMCNTQLKNIDAISSGIIPQPEAPKAAGKRNVDEAVRSIESSVARIQPEPAVTVDVAAAMDAPAAEETVLFGDPLSF